MKSIKEFLDHVTYYREEVDAFLDISHPNWAKFDPELGYTLQDSVIQDGMDGALTIGSYGDSGERRVIQYANRPCRLNTYGNSFTMCHQVSDGETWQEYLAAHFGEPIRNFGVGGYGVYQAYRRMIRTEIREVGSPYVILNIWGMDDHYRSIDSWRYVRCEFWFRDPANKNMFHSNPWVHARLDPETGAVVECPNICPTPESLYNLCDREFVYQTFGKDVSIELFLAQRFGIIPELNPYKQLAEILGLEPDFSSTEQTLLTLAELYRRYCLRITYWILEQANSFCVSRNKKLLVILSYDEGVIFNACSGNPRPDPELISFLKDSGIPFVDIIAKHQADYQIYKIPPEKYVRRLFIGHYNPIGTHWFAFAIKDDLIGWMDPKPFTYQADQAWVRFDGYLPDQTLDDFKSHR